MFEMNVIVAFLNDFFVKTSGIRFESLSKAGYPQMNDIKIFPSEPGRKPANHLSASRCKPSHSPEQKADLIPKEYQAGH